MRKLSLATGAGIVFAMIACSDPGTGDPDLGYIDESLTFEERINWPGYDTATGRRLQFVSGFSNGRAISYWFLGFGNRRTADAFFFCREGDTQCPLDEHRRLDWDAMVGNPIFTRIPGDPTFSAFWAMWKVTVPADYEPNSVKSIETLDAWAQAGKLRAETFIFDFGEHFGEPVGPVPAVMHCALLLQGTTADEDGGPMPDGSGTMMRLSIQQGWFENHRVDFIDFSRSEGIFPEAVDSEARSIMRIANIYILWRLCDVDPRPEICDLPGYGNPVKRPVSERGLGQDITNDGISTNTNNVLGAMPCDIRRPQEVPYSALWGPLEVVVTGTQQLDLIDISHDKAVSEVNHPDQVFELNAAGHMTAPKPMTEDETGNPVPGNEGQVLFNCPAAVRDDFVPFPCEANQ